jgi:hypothetical protein
MTIDEFGRTTDRQPSNSTPKRVPPSSMGSRKPTAAPTVVDGSAHRTARLPAAVVPNMA